MMELRDGMLFGMGNPLLDISANTEEDFLKKYDLKPNDAILAEEKHMPMYDEMIENYDVEFTAGGSTQNSIRVAQWLLKKPGVAIFMGCIGKDKYGKILEDKAIEAGVDVRYQYHPSVPTGACSVVITKGGTNRSLCANLAAANCFTKDHLDKPENYALMKNASFYYISGFFLTVSLETILEVAQHSCVQKKCFMMNLSAPFICSFFKDRLMKVMPYIDILFGNETEAATFAKEQNLDATSISDIALKISQLSKESQHRSRIVIITQGKDPVILAKDDKVTQFPSTQLESHEVIDTNGAGDAFVGGFLAQFVKALPLETCIKCGIYAATEIIQRSGCTVPAEPNFKP